MAAHGARRLLPMAENADGVDRHRAAGRGAGLRLPSRRWRRARRWKRCARCCAPKCRISTTTAFPSRHRGGDRPGAQRRGRRGGRRGRAAVDRRERRDEPTRLAHRHAAATAPLIVSMPAHRHRPRRASSRGWSRPGSARKDADWWIDQLYDFAADLDATIVRTAISRTVIDVNRDPSGASLYPGQATTDFARPTTFDGEPLYRDGAGAGRGRDRRAARDAASSPITPRLRREIDAAARHASAASCSTTAIRSARSSRACSRASCRMFNIGTNGGASCDPSSAGDGRATSAPRAAAAIVVNGRFKGGWITRHYGRPGRRRPRAADGARLPRLYARAGRAPIAGQLAAALRRRLRRADARRARRRFCKPACAFADAPDSRTRSHDPHRQHPRHPRRRAAPSSPPRAG